MSFTRETQLETPPTQQKAKINIDNAIKDKRNHFKQQK